jgi:hypothetical protein
VAGKLEHHTATKSLMWRHHKMNRSVPHSPQRIGLEVGDLALLAK